jgi:D-glycero-D-manno-heptose 1,7-bisphosphate phosphatase
MNRAIFIDKDGTLIEDVPYNVDPQKIRLASDCIEGLLRLQEAGFLLIIISNQSGIARGYFKEQTLAGVWQKIDELLRIEGIKLHGWYYCPHHPDGSVVKYAIECECRKPLPGMIHQAASDYQADLSSSWMIGDILHDVEAGNRAGCKTILIDNGHETEWDVSPNRKPLTMVTSINEAASFILEHEHYDKVNTHVSGYH